MRKQGLRKALPLLQLIANLPSDRDRSTLIGSIDDTNLDVLCECVHNVLHNHEKIVKAGDGDGDEIERLLPRLKADRRKLKYLCKTSVSNSGWSQRRRRRVARVGGSIGLILSALIPALVTRLARKK